MVSIADYQYGRDLAIFIFDRNETVPNTKGLFFSCLPVTNAVFFPSKELAKRTKTIFSTRSPLNSPRVQRLDESVECHPIVKN
jgi:hypothetical protein